MSKRSAIVGMLATLLLAGCSAVQSELNATTGTLPACSDKGTPLEHLSFNDLPTTYHATVSAVIDAHVASLGSIATMPLACTADTYRTLLRPTEPLRALANGLPEWGPGRDVSEADMSSVLLEYLRVYECSLARRSQFLPIDVHTEQGLTETLSDGSTHTVMRQGELTEESARQGEVIARELRTARPALERTLALIGTIDRLRPLSTEVECLKRASLDLRNALGLTAEAASCMPKIWDARGSLRDLTGE